jgi:hypothetical protein
VRPQKEEEFDRRLKHCSTAAFCLPAHRGSHSRSSHILTPQEKVCLDICRMGDYAISKSKQETLWRSQDKNCHICSRFNY